MEHMVILVCIADTGKRIKEAAQKLQPSSIPTNAWHQRVAILKLQMI